MVKVGPKIPPPSRRELERQERELKRAQGANAAQLGEPRERLALLVHRKSRSKRPEPSALGNSWKKWEKNQRRHEARRLAKAKASLASLQSQGYVDISRSDLQECDHGDAKGPTPRGDNSEAFLRNIDSSTGEIHSVMDSNDCSSVSVSGEFSSVTGTSISLSFTGDPEHSENLTSGLLVTPPCLSVDIATDDFWPEKNILSSSASGPARDSLKDSVHAEKQVEKTISPPRLSSQAPPISFSSTLPSSRPRTTINAAAVPPRLSSQKSSFIFSEPLDVSKYSNKSRTPTISGDSPTFQQTSPGNTLDSEKGVDTPVLGPLNLTPRTQASAYVSPKNLVKPVDQSYFAASQTSDWNSRSAKGILPAVHATSVRRVLRVTSDPQMKHVALMEDGPVETTPELEEDISKAGLGLKGLEDSGKLDDQIPTDSSLQSNARLRCGARGSTKKSVKSEPFPTSASDTHLESGHNPLFSDTVQIDNALNNTDKPDGDAVEKPSLNGNAIVESRTPALAPAACITHDKKTKTCQLDEIQTSFLQPRAPENGQEGPIRYPDTPPALCSGIVPPASTPRSPLLFALGLSSPPWSRPSLLPCHIGDTNPDANGSSRGIVSTLKWMLRRTLRYFWQRRGWQEL